MPSPSQRPSSASCSMANGSPSRAASVISGPVIRVRVAPGAVEQRLGEQRAGSARPRAASRTRAVPLAYCSKQPRLPQPHRTAVRAPPACGRSRRRRRTRRGSSSPSSTMPPPTPVPTVTSSRSSTSCAGAEAELAPGGGVGVVLDHDRQVDPRLELGLEVHVAPGEVGREHHRRRGPCRRSRPHRRRPPSISWRRLELGRRGRRWPSRSPRRRSPGTRPGAPRAIVPSSSTTPPAILVPPTSIPQARLIRLVLARVAVVEVDVRVEVDVLRRRTRRLGGAGGRQQPGRGLQQRRRRLGEVGPHLRAGLAHGVHGPADRAVGALRAARRDVLVDVVQRARPAMRPPALADVGALVARPVGQRAEQLGGLLADAADRFVLGVRGVVRARSLRGRHFASPARPAPREPHPQLALAPPGRRRPAAGPGRRAA